MAAFVAKAVVGNKLNAVKGAVGGDGGETDEDKEKAEEEERERQEAIREAEERRKEKHRKMEAEREKMRQEIRDKLEPEVTLAECSSPATAAAVASILPMELFNSPPLATSPEAQMPLVEEDTIQTPSPRVSPLPVPPAMPLTPTPPIIRHHLPNLHPVPTEWVLPSQLFNPGSDFIYNIKKKETPPPPTEAESSEPDNPLMRKKKTPEELAAEAEAEDQDEFTKLKNTIENQVNELRNQIESRCSLQ